MKKKKNLYGLISKLYYHAIEKYPTPTYSTLDRQQALWDVMTALRGPDEDLKIQLEDGHFYTSDDVKHLTTARIRAILGMEDDGRLGLEVRPVPLTDDEIVLRNELLKKCSQHFGAHFRNAMRTLYELGYPIPEKEMNFHAHDVEEVRENE
ncbi:MAG: hypothetical protein ACTSUO_00745 [Candidatus Thorarchaeota archaeon]